MYVLDASIVNRFLAHGVPGHPFLHYWRQLHYLLKVSAASTCPQKWRSPTLPLNHQIPVAAV